MAELKLDRIHYNAYNYPIMNFITYFENGTIYIPEYQRGLVWTVEQKQMLIDSIMQNIPIGNIFLNDNRKKDLNYEVVDGQQRLNAIMDYYENLYRWNGYLYSELPKEFQAQLTHFVINVYVTQYKTRKEVIELYYRINWTGVEHSVEELMHLDQGKKCSICSEGGDNTEDCPECKGKGWSLR